VSGAGFVHLTAKKPAPIRAFLTENFSAFEIAEVINEKRTAFSAGEVLGFVKALRSKTSKGAEVFTLEFSK
jgi:hypothetical protein